jgi:hypothetical protein
MFLDGQIQLIIIDFHIYARKSMSYDNEIDS